MIRTACAETSAPILAELPQNLDIARAYSRAILAVRALPELKRAFAQILLQIAARTRSRQAPKLFEAANTQLT